MINAGIYQFKNNLPFGSVTEDEGPWDDSALTFYKYSYIVLAMEEFLKIFIYIWIF